jgi:hypothetical protein
MGHPVIGPDLHEKLLRCKQPLKLFDSSGRVVGCFVPAWLTSLMIWSPRSAKKSSSAVSKRAAAAA